MNEIRTRFAPSPTGFMHVGNLRTALYAWLLARSRQGKFILRIEDTDQERYVENAVDVIYATLKSAGLEHDEGPVDHLSLKMFGSSGFFISYIHYFTATRMGSQMTDCPKSILSCCISPLAFRVGICDNNKKPPESR